MDSRLCWFVFLATEDASDETDGVVEFLPEFDDFANCHLQKIWQCQQTQSVPSWGGVKHDSLELAEF